MRKYGKVVAQLDKKQLTHYRDYLYAHAPKSLAEDTISDIFETTRRGLPISISEIPESYPLNALAKAASITLPPTITVPAEKQHYIFYLVEVIFNMEFKKNVYPKSAEFVLVIEDDVITSYRKSRPVQLFPCRKDKQLFRVNAEIEGAITVDAGLNLYIPMTGSGILPFGQVKSNAAANLQFKTNMVVGPFSYVFRKAAIEVTGLGRQVVRWTYNLESELGGKNMFKSYLLMKIDDRAKYVKMRAFLSVIPYKKKWKVRKHLLPKLQVPADLQVDLTSNVP